ncbi:hypothetical protein [Saccharolobus islandicus]|jgi:hypothetical protein|uniref:Uncharacterized protein n=8 Tax=Saccharolobus islandicus TaxID=43080 RepID=M9U8K5_SACIS|nr:hypothetical protein [Sulfolobus islandicus]ACP36212.1 conserved hypothetical protein [Sulfolobus islandicus L.S.2.15]ACP38801.1 conserved hypothetical protein [Sulfolobus islandicus M.14.25]ACP56006.1 conserved hypothetical protein [Sulfolobus islandicus M.16.27]ACR42669.1 conserved hypothetical protein [Sulfolobus islandicus M.16.4]ADB87971.1 conserved hypothetical protein [Sulfolobus islandicus L.D.8.5]
MTRNKAKSLLINSVRRVKISLFYLESGLIDEARKEIQKSWREVISALLILNLYSIVEDNKDREIIHYSVPRSKIFSISKSLEDRGYKDLVKISSMYFSSLQELPKSEIKVLISALADEEIMHIKEWFSEIWDEKLDEMLNEVKIRR